ncbi:MAG: hypothetical protein JO339_27850 [Alphaproteobacteria bacterium]|nr:hypothetical protein [Alphaproteobacteria bacterium]
MLRLDASADFPATMPVSISGFGVPDEIDLADIAFSSASLVGYQGDTHSGTLSITDGAHLATLLMFGNYTISSFHLTSETGGGLGTIVTDPPISGTGSSMMAFVHS